MPIAFKQPRDISLFLDFLMRASLTTRQVGPSQPNPYSEASAAYYLSLMVSRMGFLMCTIVRYRSTSSTTHLSSIRVRPLSPPLLRAVDCTDSDVAFKNNTSRLSPSPEDMACGSFPRQRIPDLRAQNLEVVANQAQIHRRMKL